MTMAAATLVRRATAIAVWLSLGVLVALTSGTGTESLQGTTPTSSQVTVTAAHAEWGSVPAARSSSTLGQRDTDPAPRDHTTGAIAVLGGMLICLALQSSRPGTSATDATAVRRKVARGRTCRAPPLPQPL